MKKFLIFLVFIFILPIEGYAKRGCCSWHGGVSHCGDNGKYVCNDGTYSPSCTCTPTISYKYGCTNQDAINYDAFANRDDGSCVYRVYGCTDSSAINYNALANTSDGSCQFEEEIIEEIEILYEEIVEEGNENILKQKGINGKKKIVTKNIKDELGNIISSDSYEEILLDPVNEIRIVKKENDIEDKAYEKETEKEENSSLVGEILGIGILIFGGYKLRKKYQK